MKIGLVLVVYCFSFVAALRISNKNHDGISELWNNFWSSFGKAGEPQVSISQENASDTSATSKRNNNTVTLNKNSKNLP